MAPRAAPPAAPPSAPTAASPATLALSAYCSHSYLSCANCWLSTPWVSTIGWLVAVQPAKATAANPSDAATAKKRFIVYPFPSHILGLFRPLDVCFSSKAGPRHASRNPLRHDPENPGAGAAPLET